MGGVWLAGDVITHARMNQKTNLSDTGANISAATAYTGMLAYCTSTGSGFTSGLTYQYNGSAWVQLILDGSVSSDIEVYPYSATIGDYSTPISATVSSTSLDGTTVTMNNTGFGAGAGWDGAVRVYPFTGLTVGKQITSVSLYAGATVSGNVRVKIYQDDGVGGGPGTLLAESGSLTQITGQHAYPLTSNATVPASGNIWAGFEIDNATGTFYGSSISGENYVTHTFGSGPSPFGSISSRLIFAWIAVTYAGTTTPATNLYDNNTATEWKSNSEVGAYAYVDYGSAVEIAGVAIYMDKTNTTATQIKIQTSSDHVTWTDKRLVNVSALTDGAWNYIRFNRDIAQNRYVRIYVPDAGSKVLAIWEVKLLVPTESQWNRRHGHLALSPTLATLPLTA